MDSPPKLTGETLIVHHIPLVHCQVPDRQCCPSSKRTNPFCQADLGVVRTSSQRERDLLQTDSLVYSSCLQQLASEADLTLAPEDKEDNAPKDPALSGTHKRQNPFVLSAKEAQDLYEDDPLEQKSFHLHSSKPAFRLHEMTLPPFRLHDTNPVVKPWSATSRLDVAEGQEDKLTSDDLQTRNRLAPESMELDEYSCHHEDATTFSFDQEWANDSDELMPHQEASCSRTCSCSSSEFQRCRCYSLSSQSEPPDQQMGYISDSSCNSSDGVLVNFSALYNKMNGHAHPNLNSGPLSCDDSSSGSHSDTGAFYLDLHSSPRDSKMSCESHDPDGSGKACGCRHPSSPVLDANCNSYPPLCDPCASEGSDLTACFQSQARLVVATQNYYKLVTCDLSSQSSPSPAGSSITSCSEEPAKGSPLVQPTEYYLFQQPGPPPGGSDTEGSRAESQGEAEKEALEGQLYVNVSPPCLSGGRQRSRSYDRNLDRSPTGRLGSLERMLSCPVKLSETPGVAAQSSPPKRVTSFAELAKGRKKNGSSPPLRASRDSSLEFSPIPECQKDSAAFLNDWAARHCHSLPPMPLAHSLNRSCENNPGSERGTAAPRKDGLASGEVPEQPFFSVATETGAGVGHKDIRARADGGAAEGKVVRYSKDQRPTTLPIQPFVFQHHFPKQSKARALHSHFAASLSQLYSLSAAASAAAAARSASQPLSSTSQSSASAPSADPPGAGAHLVPGQPRSADGAAALGEGPPKKPVPETTRPSPLGSYSPVRSHVPFFQGRDPSSSSGSPTPESHPPRSRSCPVSANLLPATRPSPATGSHASNVGPRVDALHKKESPPPVSGKEGPQELKYERPVGSLAPVLSCGRSLARAGGHPEPQWKGSCSEAIGGGPLSAMLSRPLNANHLSPQALKWREYRRRNPLGLDRVSGLTGSLDQKQQEGRLPPWRNPIFEFPGALNMGRSSCRLNGHSVRPPPLNYFDFFPDYFSLAEKPPAEFCLSPDGNTESISVDLAQKKGLVKAVNMAVDLIVAHFGTSRDPRVKAKLGNSSVSPNVGHLILKYLCPAIRDILSDGLKAYVLDVIIGQRRNIPWSVVEASTQLGPSTKVVHALYSKVSQYPELTSHTMRFNAFIFGLLNIRSLEFWFNHLYNHEDIVQGHYQPVGFLPLSHGVCQGLFEELLLLLQPLSLLPFSLDLLFEHRLLQMGKEQQQQKELLRVKRDLALSAHSTLQLMRTQGSSPERICEAWGGSGRDPRAQALQATAALAREGAGSRAKGEGAPSEGAERREDAGSDGQPQEAPQGGAEPKKDKQASWWYQLMRSSQVYIEGSAEGARFVRYEQRKKVGAAARQGVPKKGPPPREGVVEGAEACPITEAPFTDRPPREADNPAGEPVPKEEPPAKGEAKEKGHPFWMGSPPDSVLAELKQVAEEESGSAPKPAGSLGGSGSSALEGSLPKWGHLFGSRKVPKDPKHASRLPSGWLSLDRSVFQLMAQTVGASVWREAASQPERLVPGVPPLHPRQQQRQQRRPPDRSAALEASCEVKALCHHLASEAGHLSFKKGDVLQVMGKVDADWLRCGRGAESGLVPIMYVTHREDEDY